MANPMQCPDDKSSLTPATAEGHAGWRCASCSGIWLSSTYIDSLRHTRRFDPVTFRQELAANSTGQGSKCCPAGCGVLDVSDAGAIKLDWCGACQGVWFDSGELRRLLEGHPKTGPGSGGGLGGNAAFIELVFQGLGIPWK